MNGQLLSLTTSPDCSTSVQLVTFSESSRTAICHTLHIRAAHVASIRALASDAFNNGDPAEAVQQIELIAGEVFQQLNQLAALVAQVQAVEAGQQHA